MTTRFRSAKGVPTGSRRTPTTLNLGSPSFGPGDSIPVQHTADGQNLSPALTWGDLPKETRALVLICEDPDAPYPPFVHWLVADISPEMGTGLPQGVALGVLPRELPGAIQGRNSFGRIGYGGPEPPRGDGSHRYCFTLIALDAPLHLRESFTREALEAAMSGHILAKGELIGMYGRS
jgi:Raf kinase inhibitor-like YbhB/YbcL family protein